MKKGTLFPFFTPISAKKMTPVLAKSNQKSTSTQFPNLHSLKCPDLMFSLTACPPNTSEDRPDTKTTPIKSANSSLKRKSRDIDSLSEMALSFQKRLKSNAENEANAIDPIMNKKVNIRMTADINGPLIFDDMSSQTSNIIINSQESTNKSITLTQAIEELRQPQKNKRKSSYEVMSSTSRDQDILFCKEARDHKGQITNSEILKYEEEKIDLAKLVSKETLDIIKAVRSKLSRSKNSNPRPHKIFELSSETMNMIKLVQSKSVKPAQNPRSVESLMRNYSKATTAVDLINFDQNATNSKTILRSASLREKYEELIGIEREFILPVSYKRLLKAFEELDLTLNSLMSSKKPLSFEMIVEKMRIQNNRILTYTHLAQMMFVRPTAYKTVWERTDRSRGEFELLLGFPNDENGDAKQVLTTSRLEERTRAFKERLLQITKKHHIEFLNTKSQEERERDYDKLKCWHSEFDVNNCPAIPEAKLIEEKSGPQFKLLTSAEMETNNLKLLANVKEKDKQTKNVVSTFFSSHQNQIQEISNKIRDKVQFKKESSITKDQEMGVDHTKSFSEREIQQLERVARSLDDYYRLRKTQSMFFASVVDRISQENKDPTNAGRDIGQCIEDLAFIFPEWLKIIQVNGFKIIKREKSLDFQDLIRQLKK